MIKIRKATFADDKNFAELMVISAPYFPLIFGNKTQTLLQKFFRHPFNLFSFKHIYFAEIDKEKAGMILGYNWQTKKQENLRTGFLFFKKMGIIYLLKKFLLLIKFHATVGKVNNGEYYISNIALYPKFRKLGIGKRLMLEAEREAKMAYAEKIILDVEKDNIGAITFYKNLGYKIIKKFSIPLQKDNILHFYRMAKEIKNIKNTNSI